MMTHMVRTDQQYEVDRFLELRDFLEGLTVPRLEEWIQRTATKTAAAPLSARKAWAELIATADTILREKRDQA